MRRLSIILLILALLPTALPAAQNDYDVIVVGSGAGGLSAAATLAKAGKKVLLLEQHDRVGGYMTAFHRGDYRFEVSLHALDGAGPGGYLYSFFQEFEVTKKVAFKRLDPVYRSIYPDRELAVPADLEKYHELLYQTFPLEKQNLKRLLDRMEAIHRQVETGGAGLQSASGWRRAGAMLLAPMRMKDVVEYLNKSLADLFDTYLTDTKAKAVMAQLWGYLGLPPDRLSAVYFTSMWGSYHRYGAYYPIGGSQAISDALAQYVAAHGGTVRTGARVEKILVADKRVRGVRLADGTEYTAPFVVSNASVPATVEKLVGVEHWPASFVQRIRKMEISISLVQIFLGVRDRSVLAPLGGAHSVFVNGGYDPLASYRAAMDGDVEKLDPVIVDWGLTDPTCAPPGGSTVGITFAMPYDYQGRWRRDEGYEQYAALKQQVAETMMQRMERLLPGLRGAVEVMEVGTPLTMERYTLNPQGAVYGFAHTPEQSLLNRIQIETPIEGLYFAGAWTFPGGGQSACLSSGQMAAALILRHGD